MGLWQMHRIRGPDLRRAASALACAAALLPLAAAAAGSPASPSAGATVIGNSPQTTITFTGAISGTMTDPYVVCDNYGLMSISARGTVAGNEWELVIPATQGSASVPQNVQIWEAGGTDDYSLPSDPTNGTVSLSGVTNFSLTTGVSLATNLQGTNQPGDVVGVRGTIVCPAAAQPTPAPTATVAIASAPSGGAGVPWPVLAGLVPILVAGGAGGGLVAAGRFGRRRGAADAATAGVGTSDVEKLLAVSRRLTSGAVTGDVSRAVVREALVLVPAQGAALIRRTQAGFALEHETLKGAVVVDRLGDGIVGMVSQTGVATVTVTATEPGVRGLPAAIVAVPLAAAGVVIGALLLLRHPNEPFSITERDLLMAFAPMAATALQSSIRAQSAAAQAYVDPLTGAANRRRLDADLAGVLGAWEAGATSFLMIDLDHFKSVNDTYGHQAGDTLLKAIAARLQYMLRPTDRFYRFGGEEFCVVMPRTGTRDGMAIAERLRAAVAEQYFDLGGGVSLQATASFGLSTTMDLESADLIKRADEALYRAKETGRNRVCFS